MKRVALLGLFVLALATPAFVQAAPLPYCPLPFVWNPDAKLCERDGRDSDGGVTPPSAPQPPQPPAPPAPKPPKKDKKDNKGHGNGDEGDAQGNEGQDPDNPGHGPKN